MRRGTAAADADCPAQTPLERALASERRPARASTVLDAFDVARHRFARGERIDMQGIADELGVNRVTLYRWVGSREQLITEVLWATTRRSFDAYKAALGEPPFAARALTVFVQDVNKHTGMQQLLDDEPALALSLLTSRSGNYQHRYLELVRDLIRTDRDAQLMSTDIPIDDLAYTAVRITESYIHTRAITGEPPDAERAGTVLHALLR